MRPPSSDAALPLTPLNEGRPLEREVHLGDGAVHAVVLQALQEAGREMLRIDHAEQRALGIGVGDNRARINLVAVAQHDSAGDAVFHLDLRDFDRGANLDAGGLHRDRHRGGERAGAAHHVSSAACGIAVGGGTQQQAWRSIPRTTVRETCRRFPVQRSVARSSSCLEPFGDQIGDGHGPPAQEAIEVLLAEAANLAAGLQQFPDVARRRIVDVGRRHVQASDRLPRRCWPGPSGTRRSWRLPWWRTSRSPAACVRRRSRARDCLPSGASDSTRTSGV